MKPKMSKRYIGFEEPIYDKVPRRQQPQRNHENAAMPIQDSNKFLCVLGTIGGIVLRICLHTIITCMILIFSLTNSVTVNLIVSSILLFYWLSATLYWAENRVSAWMIDRYIKRGEYKKIWGNYMLHNYVVKYREDFVFNQNGLDRQMIVGLDLANSIDVPDVAISWSHEPEEHEIDYMTVKYIKSMLFFGLSREYYHLSKSIRSYAWNIIYSIVLAVIICFEIYAAFVSDWALWIRIICGMYLVLHLVKIIPSFVLTWMKESYGLSFMENDTYQENRERYEYFHEHKFIRFLAGNPSCLYFPRDRRLENGGHGNGYTWKAYDIVEPFRFLIRLLRLIIIV